MSEIAIPEFSLNGDMSLMPSSVSSYQAAMWKDWRTTIVDHMKASGAFVESEKPFTMPIAVLKFERNKMEFTVIDLDPEDDEEPHPTNCSIGFHELGKDTMNAYLMARHDNSKSFDVKDNLRSEYHLQIVENIKEKLKQAGLNFGNQDRATAGLHDLTAYWFDLLDANGNLKSRPARQGTPGIAKPAL